MPLPLTRFPFKRTDLLKKLADAGYPVDLLERSLQAHFQKGEIGRLVTQARAESIRKRLRAVAKIESCVHRYSRLFTDKPTSEHPGQEAELWSARGPQVRFREVVAAAKVLREAVAELADPLGYLERRPRFAYGELMQAILFLRQSLNDLHIEAFANADSRAMTDLGEIVDDLIARGPSALRLREITVLVGEWTFDGKPLYPDVFDPAKREDALEIVYGQLRTARSRWMAAWRSPAKPRSASREEILDLHDVLKSPNRPRTQREQATTKPKTKPKTRSKRRKPV